MAKKSTKVLALVANGDTGFDARNKINAGLTLTGDLESRIDGKADVTYVDSKVSEKISKAGDTMTGDLGLQTKEIVIWGSGSSNAARGITYKYPDGSIAGGFGFTWDGSSNSTSGFHVGPGAAGYGTPWLQVAPTYTVVNQSMFTVKASGTYSGARMYSTDTEAVFYHVNDAGYPVSGLGANTTTGIVSFTKNNPSTGAYEYTWLQFDPAAATNGVVALNNPKSRTAQGTTADSLTRKDYVDSAINTANLIADIQGIPDGSDVLDYFKTHPKEAFRNMGSNGVNLPTGWSYGNIHWLLHGLETDGTAKYGTLMMYDCGGEIFVNFLNNGTWVGWREFTTAAPATHMEARIATLEAQIATLLATATTQPVVATRKTRKKKEADNGS